ncbi:MAG: hypothetical protein WCF16_03300 [Alphaproteobacteria bacterium]
MQALYFTLVAIVLYVVADWALDRVEIALGRRLEYRTIIFFAVLLGLALASFWLIRTFTSG